MRKMESSRSISSLMASRSASRNEMTRGSDIDVVQDRLRRRLRTRFRELDGVLHDALCLVVELLQGFIRRDTERLHAIAEDLDRIALHPLLDLFLRAVLRRIGHRVSAEAIRLGLEEERQALGARPLDG